MKIRGMTSGRLASVLLVSASLGLATAVSAAVVPGGGKKSTDCAAGFEVEGTTNPTTVTSNKTKVKQKACSHSCTFSVKTCINEPVTGCTATPVTSFVPPSLPPLDLPAVGGSDHVCGSSVDVTVAEKKSMKFKLTANTSGKPDKDTLILACLKNKNDKAGNCTGGGGGPTCAKNTAGGPDQVTFTVLGQGTDLDNGWTGTSHNFPVIKDASVVFCLSGCDSSTNPICQANGPTGPPPALNGQFFGPPLPLIAGGVPVCVVNRYSGNVTGTGNVQTGEMNGLIPLFSDVFATDPTRVCPQCLNGTCDSGGKRGQSCHVDGSVTVVQSLAANKSFQLSKDCPPLGNPLSTLVINLPITTGTIGTPGTGGSKPCREKEAQGVPVKDNNCSGGMRAGELHRRGVRHPHPRSVEPGEHDLRRLEGRAQPGMLRRQPVGAVLRHRAGRRRDRPDRPGGRADARVAGSDLSEDGRGRRDRRDVLRSRHRQQQHRHGHRTPGTRRRRLRQQG